MKRLLKYLAFVGGVFTLWAQVYPDTMTISFGALFPPSPFNSAFTYCVQMRHALTHNVSFFMPHDNLLLCDMLEERLKHLDKKIDVLLTQKTEYKRNELEQLVTIIECMQHEIDRAFSVYAQQHKKLVRLVHKIKIKLELSC